MKKLFVMAVTALLLSACSQTGNNQSAQQMVQTIDALQRLVGHIKNDLVVEREIYAE